jgi:hypothetical protein
MKILFATLFYNYFIIIYISSSLCCWRLSPDHILFFDFMKAKFLLSALNLNFEADVDAESPISNIKKQISSQSTLEWDEQKWVYKGKVLLNEASLASVGFVDGDAIHVLKSVRAISETQQLSSTTPQYMPVPHFDSAMRSLLSENSDEEKIKQCILTISKVLKNIINKPLEEKYRKLKATNPLVQQKILNCVGAQDLLTAMGFALVGEEYVVQANYMAWNNITACNAKLDKFIVKLQSAATAEPATAAALPPAPPVTAAPLPTTSGEACVY